MPILYESKNTYEGILTENSIILEANIPGVQMFFSLKNIEPYNNAYNKAYALWRKEKKYQESYKEFEKARKELDKMMSKAQKVTDEKDKKKIIEYINSRIGIVDASLKMVDKKIQKEMKKANKKTTKESAFLEEKAMEFLRENYSDMISEKDFVISIQEVCE